MARCVVCGRQSPLIAASLGLCVDCIRQRPDQALPLAANVHRRARRQFDLPEAPPHRDPGKSCHLCVNECRMAQGERGYCGLRYNEGGTLRHLAGT
ncbi:MAG: hypothetical protein AMJ93_12645, partial [Anaerolineae bacterium SM23_84]